MEKQHTIDDEQRHLEELRALTPGQRLALRMELKALRKRARGRRRKGASVTATEATN